jgi:hypothetical protein
MILARLCPFRPDKKSQNHRQKSRKISRPKIIAKMWEDVGFLASSDFSDLFSRMGVKARL